MNRRDHAHVVDEISSYLPADWQRRGTTFIRRNERWVQILGLNPATGTRSEFIPYTSLDFLPLVLSPGQLIGGCATTRLQSDRFAVERWVTLKEFDRNPKALFDRMVDQFNPKITEPLSWARIEDVLARRTDDWPCLFGLVIESALDPRRGSAHDYVARFKSLVAGRPLADRTSELERLLALPIDQLRAEVARASDQKLTVN